MAYFDTHAHIQDERYEKDLSLVLHRAREAGVKQILVPGTDIVDSQQALKIARDHEGIYCAIGIHPHEAKTYDSDTISKLRTLAEYKEVVAIGEIGLDYHYDFSPRDVQKQVFRSQIELAHELDLPMIIHEREATADGLAMLERAVSDGILRDMPGVFHCFSGSWETARVLLDMGFYLGFDGPITYKNAKKAIDVIARCPRERLLIETDSPYLTPEPFRGRRNEPARVTLVAKKVAAIWNLKPDEAGDITTNNGCRLFSLSDC